jgi:hypothetical protein
LSQSGSLPCGAVQGLATKLQKNSVQQLSVLCRHKAGQAHTRWHSTLHSGGAGACERCAWLGRHRPEPSALCWHKPGARAVSFFGVSADRVVAFELSGRHSLDTAA